MEKRAIKFRALKQHTRVWAYGYVDLSSNLPSMWQKDKTITVIDPKTVGQFTGLKDKNGIEIFEGDIVENPALLDHWKVVFEDGAFQYCLIHDTNVVEPIMFMSDPWKVIGNIHENAELTK